MNEEKDARISRVIVLMKFNKNVEELRNEVHQGYEDHLVGEKVSK